MKKLTYLFAIAFWFVAGSARPARAVEILEEIVQENYEVDPNATLSITDTDGSIRIYGADITQISLTAIKKAYSDERLQALKVNVTADRRAVVVDTAFPAAPDHWTLKDRSGTVEYMLIVPLSTRVVKCDLVNGEILVEGLRGGSATAQLVNGWLGAHNCFADLDLGLANGRVDVAFDWWEGKSFVAKAKSVNGGIRAVIPSDAGIQVKAKSAHGQVTSALPATTNEKPPRKSAPSLSFELGEPQGCELSLETENGNVKIEKTY